MLLDDLEAIETDHPTFRSYLDDVALEAIRGEGGTLFVGPILHAMMDPPGTERIHDGVVTFAPPPSVTARIFSMNLHVLMERGEPVVWTMRQVAIRSSG